MVWIKNEPIYRVWVVGLIKKLLIWNEIIPLEEFTDEAKKLLIVKTLFIISILQET